MYIGVPFSGCEKFGNNMLICTREDEALAIAVGAWFTGKTPLVAMQNSGFGNCFDIITSLLMPYEIDIEIIINNRAEPEHHKPMWFAIEGLLDVLSAGGFNSDKVRMC